MSEKPNKTFIKQRRIVLAIVACIVLLPVLIYDIFLFGGNIPLYAKWIECGQKPVVASGSGFMNEEIPHYAEPSNFSLFRQSVYYICTPIEAERAGFSASEHTRHFPELDAIGEERPNRVDWGR